MKTTTILLLTGTFSMSAQRGGNFAQVPFFTDDRVVKQRLQQLHKQGVTEFAVYQVSVPTVVPGSKTDDGLDFGRAVTYCFWKTGNQEYAQKYTDSTTYAPVIITSKPFDFPAYATTGVTKKEMFQLKFVPPVTQPMPAPRPRQVVIFSAGGHLCYFETKEQLTYIADPARQRRREQWAARLQAAATQAEARFGKSLAYKRPGPGEPE